MSLFKCVFQAWSPRRAQPSKVRPVVNVHSRYQLVETVLRDTWSLSGLRCSDSRYKVCEPATVHQSLPRYWSSLCLRSPPGRGSVCWQENRPLQTTSSDRRTGRGCLRTLWTRYRRNSSRVYTAQVTLNDHRYLSPSTSFLSLQPSRSHMRSIFCVDFWATTACPSNSDWSLLFCLN